MTQVYIVQLQTLDITVELQLGNTKPRMRYALFITGYKNGDVMDTSALDKLSIGEWKSEVFTGAILNAENVVESDGVEFFKEVT